VPTSPTHGHLTTTRLHLLLALGAALTGTLTGSVYGVAVAATVVALVVLRAWAGAHLDAYLDVHHPDARSEPLSGAVGARVLAGAEGRGLLQHAGHARQRPTH
jgi:hypothetical protein